MDTIIEPVDRDIIAGILNALSRGEKTITYGELSKRIRRRTGRDLHPHMGFGYPLSRIQDYCSQCDVPCLSAMVVDQSQNPGSGFAQYYRAQNPSDDRTDEEIVSSEQERCVTQDSWSALLAFCGIPQSLVDDFGEDSLDSDAMVWSRLVPILDQYEKAIDSFRTEETYKWDAAKCFQEHWDLDAPDFPDMLEKALAKTDNLLASNMYFSRGMISEIAADDPEATRSSLRALFDEQIDLKKRLASFSSSMDRQLAVLNAHRAEQGIAPAKNHYQDPHAMSVYLSLARNSTHYLFKPELFTGFAQMVGFPYSTDKYQKVVDYERLCNLMLGYLETRRPDLIEKSDGLLDNGLKSADPKHRLLVQDIIFFTRCNVSRTWSYAPGEQAAHWEDLREAGVMGIGWSKIGDPSRFDKKKDLREALSAAYGKANPTNDTDTVWSFAHNLKPGDTVWVRQGLSTVIGRGIVKSDYRFDETRAFYPSVRDVEWEDIEPFEVPGHFSQKTLSELNEKTSVTVSMLEELSARAADINTDDATPTTRPTTTEKAPKSYWWLTASPKIWSLSSARPGAEQSYTIYTDNGTPRRVHANFLAVKPGDVVIGYEATPVKKAVCLCEISKPSDDKSIYFKKIRDLMEPVPYAEVKTDEVLSQSQFIKNPNGSLFALTKEEYDRILELSGEDNPVAPTTESEQYGDADFLRDVYVSERDLHTMKRLLERKKNLILQGAPGTGKTFCAKRLAWDIMGEQDENRICQVQFHQNTAYDDMMAGYRPSDEGGFEAVPGEFLRFCDRASRDPNRPWFFIIDEINRANISKVFGELLMLIEAGHRDESVRLPLLDRNVSVPENLYLIGMMNTADRGLALIDYALRRRFAFFEMEPAFDNARFIEAVEGSGNDKLLALAQKVRALNAAIADDPSLGPGFRIGHSYFLLRGDVTDEDVRDVIEYELAPLLREYWFDAPETADTKIDDLRSVL